MIKVSHDTPKILALEGKVERLEEALAAKTADFDRLCKDFDAHDAELKRIIAGLRADRPQDKPKRASTLPAPRHGPCNLAAWGILVETDAEFKERAGTQVAEVDG